MLEKSTRSSIGLPPVSDSFAEPVSLSGDPPQLSVAISTSSEVLAQTEQSQSNLMQVKEPCRNEQLSVKPIDRLAAANTVRQNNRNRLAMATVRTRLTLLVGYLIVLLFIDAAIYTAAQVDRIEKIVDAMLLRNLTQPAASATAQQAKTTNATAANALVAVDRETIQDLRELPNILGSGG